MRSDIRLDADKDGWVTIDGAVLNVAASDVILEQKAYRTDEGRSSEEIGTRMGCHVVRAWSFHSVEEWMTRLAISASSGFMSSPTGFAGGHHRNSSASSLTSRRGAAWSRTR